jgi:hypothetical protein
MKLLLSVPLLPGLRADNNNTPMTFEALKETFRAKGQAQYIDYLDNITGPQGRGHWILSTNHLALNNLAPQIWCTWESAYRIQDAVLMQDYSPPTGANGKARTGIPTYPVILLWYFRIRQDSDTWSLSSFSWAIAEKSLLPAKGSSPGFQRYSSPPECPHSRGVSASGSYPGAFCTGQNSGKRQGKESPQASDLPAMNATTASFLGLRRRHRRVPRKALRKALRRAPASQCARKPKTRYWNSCYSFRSR